MTNTTPSTETITAHVWTLTIDGRERPVVIVVPAHPGDTDESPRHGARLTLLTFYRQGAFTDEQLLDAYHAVMTTDPEQRAVTLTRHDDDT